MVSQSTVCTETSPLASSAHVDSTLHSAHSVLSIKPFVYHVTTLENFKNWLASGTWHLATGNWQAPTDGERNCLIYILSSHYGAQQKITKAWEKCRIGKGQDPVVHWGDHVLGAFQFARRLSARQRKRESEGKERRRGETERPVWQSPTISGKCVFILGHFALIESELCPHTETKRNEYIRWHPQQRAVKWFLIIFLNL